MVYILTYLNFLDVLSALLSETFSRKEEYTGLTKLLLLQDLNNHRLPPPIYFKTNTTIGNKPKDKQ